MPVHNNFLTPTVIRVPTHNLGPIRYRVKIFQNIDIAVLEADVAAFLDALAVDGLPWPHLVHTNYVVYPSAMPPNKDEPLHHVQITYMLIG